MRKLITALIVVFIFVVSVRAEIIRGRVIWIHDGDTDHYGRMVGIILYKNRDICREMILNGHAWHYVQYAPKQKNYAEAEQHARKNKLGIWSGKQKSPVPPWEWRKMKRKKRALNERPDGWSFTRIVDRLDDSLQL